MGKSAQRSLDIGFCLIILGWTIIGIAVWIYYKLSVAEEMGLNFRFHWFFYTIYKLGGRIVASIAVGTCGLGVFLLGLRKML